MANPIKPTVGRIVHYVTKDNSGNLQLRPAIIVETWSDECINLQVFTDGFNDNEYGVNVMWKTSVLYDQSEELKERTWRWMDYQLGQAKKTEELTEQLKQQ